VFRTSYSATDWLIRRWRIRWARLPETLMVSFAANSETSHPFEVSFDRESLVGAARDSRDALADDDVEPSVRSRCLVQEVRDPAVAGDRDVEAVVVVTAAAAVELHPAGLDVVEVRDDDPGFGQGRLAVPQLAKDRLPRVLLLLCGGSPQERDADLVAEESQWHA
jgi:hypothetical protein